MRKIIDGVMLFDELDLLEFRMRLLDGLVDQHVIVESNLTFSGKPKPYNFFDSIERFGWAINRIIYLPLELEKPTAEEPTLPFNFDVSDCGRLIFCGNLQSSYFQREYAQRNHLNKVIDLFKDDDVFLISDIDEIPTRELLTTLKQYEHALNQDEFPLICAQQNFCYSLKWLFPYPAYGTIITTPYHLRRKSPQEQHDRFHRTEKMGSYFMRHEPGGWHLSYFGSIGRIQEKLKSFSHQEFNQPQFLDPTHITTAMKTGTDLFEMGISLKSIEPELPGYFRELMPSFPQLFAKGG